MTEATAYVAPARQARAEDQLIRDYVDLGVTVGYIGNCDLGMNPKYDDRSFRVFCSVASLQCFGACDQSITVSREDALAENWDTPAVREKLDAIRAKLADGKLKLVGADRWLAKAKAAVAAGEMPKYWMYV